MLAVATGHPLARYESVTAEVLTDYPVTNWSATPLPASILRAIVPEHTPSGRPVPAPVRTIGEGASLIARGHAVHPTVATMAKAFSRDDTVVIPIRGLPPLPLGSHLGHLPRQRPHPRLRHRRTAAHSGSRRSGPHRVTHRGPSVVEIRRPRASQDFGRSRAL